MTWRYSSLNSADNRFGPGERGSRPRGGKAPGRKGPVAVQAKDRRRDAALLFGLALIVRLTVAAAIPQPGYTDTAYYTAGAVHMADGGGFAEPFIWNYLSDPPGIPHPGFLYWMPLPALLAAPAGALLPGSFFAMQMPFALLSSALPILAYALAHRATGERSLAWAAGLLAIFGGFFFPYWSLPETFAPFALFGSLAFWLAGSAKEGNRASGHQSGRWLIAGLMVGLAHLTRADGILLLPFIALAPILASKMNASRRVVSMCREPGGQGVPRLLVSSAPCVALVVAGYAAIMGPWMVRNMTVLGTPLSPAAAKTLWLTEYDDLFCYGCDLSPTAYLSWGWPNIIHSKLSAMWINLQRFLAENCLIILLPLAIVGLPRLWRRRDFKLATLYLAGVYLAHSLVFTFPGWRGGFFHASSAALPFLYAASMRGLQETLRWAVSRRRRWRYREARTVFAAGIVATAIGLSAYAARQKIPDWRAANALHKTVDRWLAAHDGTGARVMVGDPPAFWYQTRRQATVIPNGEVEAVLEVAERYGISYLLLEADHPAPLDALHAGQEGHPRLRLVEAWSEQDAVLYAIERLD